MTVIQTFCSRFEMEDSEAFASLFADDATYVDSLYGLLQGREAIKAFHARCHREARSFRFQPLTILYNGEGMASFEWQFSFISLMPYAHGKEISLKGGSFLKIHQEKIISYREYADSVVLLLQGNIPDGEILAFYRRKYM